MTTAILATASPFIVNGKPEGDPVLHIPRDAHTLAGFRRWVLSDEFPEKQPILFLKGEIYFFMPKENIQSHGGVKTAIAETTVPLYRKELDLGDVFINGVQVTNVDADVSNNPDLVGVLWESLESGKVRYITNKDDEEIEIEGSPDWLVEIVSDSSIKKDKRDLRQAYHEAGVSEYWIIDARGVEIDFQILYWRKSGYVAAPRKNGWQASRIFGRSFKLTRSRDRRGGWRYALAVKAE